MIIKIFKQGTNSGKEHIDYLFNEEKHEGFIPKSIKGNRFLTEEVLSNISSRIKNKYCSGVISFRDGEELNSNQLQELMNSFERTFAPFDDPGRVNFLWVQHRDKGRNELHFICPQVDLKTEKQFSLHPNSKTTLLHFEHFTRLQNYKHGFKQVDNKDYFKSNYNFSVKLVKDLTVKKANFFSSRYCEKKSLLYNKRTTTKKGLQNERKIDITKSRGIREKSNEPLVHSSNQYNIIARRTEQINQGNSKEIGRDRTERGNDFKFKSSEINNVRNEREVQGQSREKSTRTDSSISSKIQALNSLPFEQRRQELIALMNSTFDFDESMSLMNELIKITGQINSQIGDLPTQQKKPKF